MNTSNHHRLSGLSPQQHVIGASVSLGIHGLLFICFLYASHSSQEPDQPLEEVQWVSLTALGEELPPQSVPRIVAPPPPPPPEDHAVSISRQIKKDPPKKKKKKKKKKDPPKKKKRKAKVRPKKRQKKPPKKVSMNDLFGQPDERADRGPRAGHKKGSALGTSLTLSEKTELGEYVGRVRRSIDRNLTYPASISASVRKKLSIHIFVRLNKKRQIKGQPRIKKKSGNSFFDQAVLKTIDLFSEQGSKRFPIPPATISKYVFKKGFLIKIKGE